ncbi:MAG TPA: zinc ribbon domain-containing protein [Acidimicrobiia bacterium]|nr:zinc ribbon domain-containing protein [Acidimicrobiia bacterium]
MALAACPACGHRFSSGAFFCPECGRSLRREEHAPRRLEPHSKRRGRSAIVALGVTPDGEPIRPRPAAQVAHRPLSFPSPIGVAMTLGGSLLVLVGALILRLPDNPLTVFGYAGGRWLPLACGVLIVVLALAGASSPSRGLRSGIALTALTAAAIAFIDTRRLVGESRGAGLGLTLVGALVALGGTMLRQER